MTAFSNQNSYKLWAVILQKIELSPKKMQFEFIEEITSW